MSSVTIITITGPTCSGKTVLAQRLVRLGIPEIRSFTSRPAREGETNGRQYDFVTEEQAQVLIASDQCCQHARINGNLYGSTIEQVKDCAKPSGVCCIVVEPSGVHAFAEVCKRMGWRHLAVYVNNPLERILERFLRSRVRNDKKTPLDFTAKRLVNLVQTEYREWPLMASYDIWIDEMDDRSEEPSSRTDFIANQITEWAFSAESRAS